MTAAASNGHAPVAVQSAGFAINNPARTAIIQCLVEARLLPAATVRRRWAAGSRDV